MDGLGGGMMRGSGRGLRFNLDFPSSSSPGSLSPSWTEGGLRSTLRFDHPFVILHLNKEKLYFFFRLC